MASQNVALALGDVMEDSANASRCKLPARRTSRGRKRKETAAERAARAERARRAYVPAEAAKQRHCEFNEEILAQRIGGRALPNDEAMDVLVEIDGQLHGIEMKTMYDQKNGKITIKPGPGEALERKLKWGRDNSAPVHVVIIDDRDKFAPQLFSGHRMYYKCGVGSFRIGGMIKVRDERHLIELMRGCSQ